MPSDSNPPGLSVQCLHGPLVSPLSFSYGLSPFGLPMAQWSRRSTVPGTVRHKSCLFPGVAVLSAHWVPFLKDPSWSRSYNVWARVIQCMYSHILGSNRHGLFQIHYWSPAQIRVPVPKWHLLPKNHRSKLKREIGHTLCLQSLERGMIVYCCI